MSYTELALVCIIAFVVGYVLNQAFHGRSR